MAGIVNSNIVIYYSVDNTIMSNQILHDIPYTITDNNNIYTNRVSIKAKGKAFDMMTYVYGALMVSFALMGVDMSALLLLVFAYLFVHGFGIYYRIKFDKEM